MKKIFAFALVFVCVQLTIIQYAAAQENKKVRKMLVGIWKIYDLEFPDMEMDEMSEKEKKVMEDGKKMMEDGMEETREKSSFNFMQDGRYEIKMTIVGQENKESGTWKVDKEGKNFITINEKGKETMLSIKELGKNKLILKDGNTSLVLVK